MADVGLGNFPQLNDHDQKDGDISSFLQTTDILTLDNPMTPYPDDADNGLATNSETAVKEDNDKEAIQLSVNGVLDEETVARGLSNLGRSADGLSQVYLNVAIPGFNLTDISLLEEYVYLQKVEIPYNSIADLSSLGKLHHLLYLDASHNVITSLLDFTPPHNLQEVDLSYNQLTAMCDLSAHHALRKLVLDNNTISEICGLEKCHRLHHLSLAHNAISVIQGLDNLPLQHLNLCHNKIKKIKNLDKLKYLRTLNLAGNCIRSLQGLEDHNLLESIDLEDNEVIDLFEIKFIQGLRMLRELNLLRNPIQELPDYRLAILFRIPILTQLDLHRVDVEEKVRAKNVFNPSMEIIAARDHIMHVVYNFLQPSRIWDSTLPNVETPYPMLVLVGPTGSGKKDLSMKLVEEFSDYFGYGISHTTRSARPDEENGKDYYFVSMEKFEMDIKMGQFLQTYRHDNSWYGLQMESVECVAREGLACVVHMELEGVLTMKNTYFEPRYVLITPLDRDAHERRLRGRNIYSEEIIEKILQRADLYCSYNQDHPGFFDMMINSDDIGTAYINLRHLVMDYLGISTLSSFGTNQFSTTDPAEGETIQAAGANQQGTRTWSKKSLGDSASQTRGSASGKGILEVESYNRRHSAAKDVVSGYIPPKYEQLLTQYPRSAPQTVIELQGLGDEDGNEDNNNSKQNFTNIPGSPDSTTTDASSSYSDLDSAAEMHRPPSLKVCHLSQTAGSEMLPTKMIDPFTLIDEKGYHSASKQRMHEMKSPSAPHILGSGHGSRPGSSRHKVLPPIAAQ